MAEAGWYDDPTVPGGLRYWDGAQWTEHAQAPPAAAPPTAPPPAPPGVPGVAAQAPGAAGPPPFDPTAVWQNPGTGIPANHRPAHHNPARLNDVGDWIKRSFNAVVTQFVPLTLLLLPQLVVGAAAYFMLDRSVRGAFITSDVNAVQGFDRGLFLGSIGLFIVSVIIALITTLAVSHSLYGAHVGRPPSAGSSFMAGLAATPRFIGNLLLIYLAMALVFAVLALIGVAVRALVGGQADGLIVLLIVLAYIAFMVASIWVSIKLVFLTVGAAVIPRGTSVIGTSWNVTTGHFWAIFGRQLLLGLILGAIGMVVYLTGYLATVALIFSTLGFTNDGRVTVNGQDIETLDVFLFSDFLPNPAILIATIAVFSFFVYFIQAVASSGTAALYADIDGPNVFGHSRRG